MRYSIPLIVLLSALPAPARPLGETPESHLRLSGRSYVASTLSEAFGPAAEPTIAALVTKQIAAFGGGPCDPNGEDCPRGLSQLPIVPSSSALRQALITRACQGITGLDAAVKFAAGTERPNVPSESDIARAFDLFYTGRHPPDEVLAALKAIAAEAEREGLPPLDQWRFVLDALCESPAWQVP